MMLDPTPDDHTVGPDAACAGIEAGLRSRGPRPGATDVALRSYGDGYVAVGIAGPVDRDPARRFGTLPRGLRPFSTRELLLTLALLGPWEPHPARVIGQTRVHHLIDGGRLDLRGAPSEMFAVLGAPRPTIVEGHPIPAPPRPGALPRAVGTAGMKASPSALTATSPRPVPAADPGRDAEVNHDRAAWVGRATA